MDEHRYQLERLRRRTLLCGCPDKAGRWCRHEFYQRVLYNGEDGYRHQPALRGAFRKGREAWKAGVSFHDCPYDQRWRYDRKGRPNSGFGAAFRQAWEAGWAWAEWEDPAEVVLRALSAPAKEFHDPDRWRIERDLAEAEPVD